MKQGWIAFCLLVFVAGVASAQDAPAPAPDAGKDQKQSRKQGEAAPTRVEGRVLAWPSSSTLLLEDPIQRGRQIAVSLTPTTIIDGRKNTTRRPGLGELVAAHVYSSGDGLVATAIEHVRVYEVPPRGVKFKMPPSHDKRLTGQVAQVPAEGSTSLTLRSGKRERTVELSPSVEVWQGDTLLKISDLPTDKPVKLIGYWKDKATFVAERVELKPVRKPRERKAEKTAEPAKPAEAAKPTEPAAKPAEEAKPAETPAKPAEEAKPAAPPAKPAEDAKPTEPPAKPAEDAKPAEQAK